MLKKITFKREFIMTALSQIVQVLGKVLVAKILAVLMTKSEYGYYSLALSVYTLVSMYPFTAFDQALRRYASIYMEGNNYKKFYFNIFIIYFVFFIGYLIIIAIVQLFGIIQYEWEKLLPVLIIYIITETYKTTIYGVEESLRKRNFVAYSRIFEYVCNIVFIFLIYRFFTINIYSVLLIFSLVDFLIILADLIKNRTNIDFSQINIINLKILFNDIWMFSYPMLAWAIFVWMQNMSNRWFLQYYLNESAVGEFYVLTSIVALPTSFITGIIYAFLLPIIYEKENNDKGYAIRFVLKLLPIVFAVFALITIFVFFFKDLLIIIAADKKYLNNSWMLPYMLAAASVQAVSSLSTIPMLAQMKTRKLMLPSILPGIISLICGLFLIKQFFITGAFLNYIITNLSYAILVFAVFIKECKNTKITGFVFKPMSNK